MILGSRRASLLLCVAAALAVAGPSRIANATAAKPGTAAPTASALLSLDKQAARAYVNGDAAFFKGFLSNQFVMQQGGTRISKSDLIRMISGVRCAVRKGWAFTHPRMLKLSDDAYVLSYVSDMQGSCTADGKTEAMPSPIRAATVWVRDGARWRVAFHGTNLIVNPAAPSAGNEQTVPAKSDPAATSANTDAASVASATDPITDALMQAENAVWGAWMHKDAPKIGVLTARHIAFVDLFGTYTGNKAATTKAWTSALCEVSGFSLTHGIGTLIAPKVAILTLTGTVDGSCGGKDIRGQKVYGNSVYVKQGNAWKWAFGFNSPT